MDDAGSAAWPGGEQFDLLGPPADSDFGMLDFENIDLDFPIDSFNPVASDNQQFTELADSLDVQHLQSGFSPALQDQHGDAAPIALQDHASGSGASHNANMFDFTMSQYSSAGTPVYAQAPAHAHANMYRPQSRVPPTPNSMELHGDASHYLQHVDSQQTLFDQGYQSFTPLVSPAVTPHEAQFRVPSFTTVPGAYFSPLTSPALNAQSHQHVQTHMPPHHASDSSNGTSPLDIDMDILGEAAVPQPQSESGRRLRKRAVPRSTNTGSRPRQSPIMKPQRRKPTVSSLVPPKEVSELVEEAQRLKQVRTSPMSLGVPQSRENSDLDSVSPETLTEMGPPPKPASVHPSPAVGAQDNGKSVCPATPASLMRLQNSPALDMPIDGLSTLNDLVLPEASIEPSALPRLDTRVSHDDESTPRMPARKTPKLNPLSTPSAGVALSGKPSPALSAVASPTSPSFSMNGSKRVDSKLGRTPGKKRGSVSSTLVSPALRPKISPSIKPLLPEGRVTDDTHALLLASKSNYQNILDGTTVPGVVYPTSLSTNLTSKRTSHKIAEQGRRNRINTALQEMQALLPSPHLTALAAKEAKNTDTSAAASNNSKAAKVESAIDYIKQLQRECADRDKLLEQKDLEMAALRKELAELKQGDSSSNGDAAEPMKTASSTPDQGENAT